ncbi:hypothetical protein AcV5_001166 [Taiwanofungus camphoratus]|nr:hypothetical protein AcV7_003419 [Antrodia cinnamomea]KAI0939921.1 hypothetical protein AcV5_001166 [Antrodia cinnamomea]
MPSSQSGTPSSPPDDSELEDLIAQLSVDPEREPIASEIGVLQSIYGDHAVCVWHPQSLGSSENAREDELRHENGLSEPGTIRYEVTINVSSPDDPSTTHPLTILVSLSPPYPTSVPPQLQLLSRYLGPFGTDATLFGAVLRTYISRDGVEWMPGGVCVFDGLEWVRERCMDWLREKMNAVKVGGMVREDEREVESVNEGTEGNAKPRHEHTREMQEMEARIPEGVEIIEAEPIHDRKSVFVGRACRITDPLQVQMILAHLMSDRKIARAAHPIINAWRCRVGNILHQDNDDDGETAAGGRLAHLLQILEVDNVLVVVTRYYGGIHLGPDRFKHINQAARNALELGGFLDAPGEDARSAGSKKKKGRGAHR